MERGGGGVRLEEGGRETGMKERDGLGLQYVDGKNVGEIFHNGTSWDATASSHRSSRESALSMMFRIEDPTLCVKFLHFSQSRSLYHDEFGLSIESITN